MAKLAEQLQNPCAASVSVHFTYCFQRKKRVTNHPEIGEPFTFL
jgi:hypothetical protein